MNGHQMLVALKDQPQLLKLVAGIWCAEALQLEDLRPPFFPCVYVVNILPRHSQSKMGHWTIFHFKSQHQGEFFCSGGIAPTAYHNHFERFLLRHSETYQYNEKALQHPSSLLCGQYCLMYLYHIAKGYSLKEFVRKCFVMDKAVNDKVADKFCPAHFPSLTIQIMKTGNVCRKM